ncbi:TspO/MBR family protein [Azorhizobium doebereinerae]|uniref:TspO/MBR family protein n=1 Tax=Azorhizobium doebereinerae TaxID=281091 RepID=UPI0004277B63|nr:TspO/MBR family protein [Azorhizobium doebereinerae]
MTEPDAHGRATPDPARPEHGAAEPAGLLSLAGLRALALAIVPVAATSIVGQVATLPNLAPWYAGLAKPAYNPPNWAFGPAWTLLFALMAYAAWRILRLPAGTPGRAAALVLFFVQLAFNAAWSWMFFHLHSPLLGLVNIIPQWLLILATIAAFRRVDRPAAWCLVPLAAWVAFASLLNFGIWRLNG